MGHMYITGVHILTLVFMLEKNKKLHHVFRHNCSQRNEIFGITEEIKNWSWVNTIVCYQLSTREG